MHQDAQNDELALDQSVAGQDKTLMVANDYAGQTPPTNKKAVKVVTTSLGNIGEVNEIETDAGNNMIDSQVDRSRVTLLPDENENEQ